MSARLNILSQSQYYFNHVEFSRCVVQNMVRHQMPHIELFFLNIRYATTKDHLLIFSFKYILCKSSRYFKIKVSERHQKVCKKAHHLAKP